MIGGSSTGSGWSFFRSSSSQSSSRDQSRGAHDSTSRSPPPTSASTLHPQDGQTPQSGNKDIRSAVTPAALDDLRAVDDDVVTEQAGSMSHAPLYLSAPSDFDNPSSTSTHNPPSPTTNVQAPLGSPPFLQQSVSGTSLPSPAIAASSRAPPPTYHLHSLTERKLEKAVLGRAVGLRQLVLLSNAFASRPAAPLPPPEETPLRYPYASTDQSHTSFDEEEVIDYEEDEAERKRREEDWLDSVLDEMLTDADDEEDEQEQTHSSHPRIPTRSEREFREPYVHLSIKHAWQSSSASTSSSSPITYTHAHSTSLLAQHAAMLEEESESDTQHMEVSPPSLSPLYLLSEEEQFWPSDSGFMEPCSIPLPESTEASPDSSAHSQASDDGHEDARLPGSSSAPEDHDERADDACQACELVSEELWRETGEETHVQGDLEHSEHSQGGIPISLPSTSALAASPHSFTSTSLPDLAYSANSFNTLSSSPSHSINLYTPGTSPPALYSPSLSSITSVMPSQAEREKQAWREAHFQRDVIDSGLSHLEPQEIMLPMDDLDIYDEEREEEQSSTSSRGDEEKTSSSGSTTSNEDRTRHCRPTSHRGLSLELVRYRSGNMDEQDKSQEDDALRIPLYIPLSASGPTGLFSSRMKLPEQTPAMPPLPPSLLSVMMGRTPAIAVEIQSASRDLSETVNQSQSSYRSTLPRKDTESSVDKLRLPIFLPSEIVKSLYDSVDFGIPQCISSPTSSPLTSPLQSPLVLPFEVSSAPSSPSSSSSRIPGRSRSKSLTLLDPLLPNSNHASPGGLLFSSLGLFGSSGDYEDAKHGSSNNNPSVIWDPTCASQRRRSLSSTPLDTFVRGSRERYTTTAASTSSRSRNMLHTAARKESRSPSRLRLFLDHEDPFVDDFEFGSI